MHKPLTRSCLLNWSWALSHKGLRDSHIFLSPGNGIDGCHGGELVPTSSHRLWTGWFVVAIPSSEASGDPREPSERAWLIKVLLACSLSFECRAAAAAMRS